MNVVHVLNSATWISFFVGLLTVTIAYLSSSFAGGLTADPQQMKRALTLGTSLMYLALLVMPAIPLVYHAQKKNLNGLDYAAAGTAWTSYLLLPVALNMWDKPGQKATTGAVVLGASVAALVTSVVLERKAESKRRHHTPSSSGY